LKKPEAFSGRAYRISYDHEERNRNVSIHQNSRSSGTRTDLGFGSLADSQKSAVRGGYNWFSENTWWNKIRLSGDWDISHNNNSKLIEKEAEVSLSMNGQLQSYFKINFLKRDKVGF
jgi:uncharacterized surface anchored protein